MIETIAVNQSKVKRVAVNCGAENGISARYFISDPPICLG